MKILLIQLRRVGDILLTTPVIRFLKEALPAATVHFLAEPLGLPLLETNPHPDHLWIYDKNHPVREIKRVRKERYDAVFDFMNNPRTSYFTALSGARWKVAFTRGIRKIFYNLTPTIPVEPEYVPHRKLRLVKHWLQQCGIPVPPTSSARPELYLTDADRRYAQSWLEEEGLVKGGFAILVPVPRYPIRQWRVEGFRHVALDLVTKKGVRVYLAWGPGEEVAIKEVHKGYEDKIGLLPLTSLREMAAIFENAKFVLTNESGSMHVAVSVGTPTITIYGPTRPIDWNPSLAGEKGSDVALTAKGVPCLGCHLQTCPVGHICMTRLPDEQVLEACEHVIGGVRR